MRDTYGFNTASFTSTGVGFQITFDNGWTISVQWGPGNYSDNQMEAWVGGDLSGLHERVTESTTAEIAAWDADDAFWWDFSKGSRVKAGSSVKGWVKPDQLVGYMQEVSQISEF
jgi:hypothetical protein|tara:strand:- start:38 stop:379 length:342 start_codon:yes stop_codon:yes gene_type:complete